MPTNIRISPRRAAVLALAALVSAAAFRPATAESRPSSPEAATPEAATPEAAARVAATHRVRMLFDDKGYRFEPARLTIDAGDRVTFVLVSGAPHNVEFDADSVPAAAKAKLAAAMPDAVSDLMGPMLMNDGETYTISFAGLPAGTYRYFCTPHVAMDMAATIVVRPARAGAKGD